MHDICCVGHITSDKVVTPASVQYMPGGTAWYFSWALSGFDIDYALVTALGSTEMHYVDGLKSAGINTIVQPSRHTVFFENIYGDNPDNRTQNVLETADAFLSATLQNVQAKVFHLGPLLAGDFSLQLIESLAGRGLISLDVQGYLRRVEDKKVYSTDWHEKREALKYIDIVKADVGELKALTGSDDPREGAKILTDWGVKEAVITNGSQGSFMYSDGVYYDIPAYRPAATIDTTGCGDTYIAGYLYQRVKGFNIETAGQFAAAISGLKTGTQGPFKGPEDEVKAFLKAL